MKKFMLIILCASVSLSSFAQSRLRRWLPTDGFSLQYAGSIGFMSAGYFRQTHNLHHEFSFIYGYTPQSLGGPLSGITLKYTYNPLRFRIANSLQWDPIQAGMFITAWFGENLDLAWSAKYPKGYYWWQSSLRKHAFISSQLSFVKKRVEKVSVYFEVNTNDLYLVGYYPNRETQTFTDILFFGIGAKVYLNERQKTKPNEPIEQK
jgi:hypothetical protein